MYPQRRVATFDLAKPRLDGAGYARIQPMHDSAPGSPPGLDVRLPGCRNETSRTRLEAAIRARQPIEARAAEVLTGRLSAENPRRIRILFLNI